LVTHLYYKQRRDKFFEEAQEEDLHHQEKLAHKWVLSNPRRLAPKRGAHFSQEGVLVEISKHTQKI
jgi:hypothetical protein